MRDRESAMSLCVKANNNNNNNNYNNKRIQQISPKEIPWELESLTPELCMPKPESVFENEMHKILLDFEIQTDDPSPG